MDDGNTSGTDNPPTWVDWLCAQPGHSWLVAVPEDYIRASCGRGCL